MNTQLFIPKTIKVGFQERSDTYSKKLAYVIYFDAKGVLRKEKSWEGWRDKKIDSQEFDNSPTEGFVLNKKVGGYKSDWNHRATYTRVFDPRGFEFEISIPNLLYILQETDCTKGKGLIGEFVYCWDGTELVLLPVGCETYKSCTEYTSLQGNKVSAKEMILGAVYEDKKQNKYIYLGRHDWHEKTCSWKRKPGDAARKKKKNAFIFAETNTSERKKTYSSKDNRVVHFIGLTSFSRCVNDTPVEELAALLDKFKGMHESSPIVGVEWGKKEKIKLKLCGYKCDYHKYDSHSLFTEESDGRISCTSINENYEYNRNYNSPACKDDSKYIFYWNFNKDSSRYSVVDGEVIVDFPMVISKYSYRDKLEKEESKLIKKILSEGELLNTEENILYAILGSGQKTEFKNIIN